MLGFDLIVWLVISWLLYSFSYYCKYNPNLKRRLKQFPCKKDMYT